MANDNFVEILKDLEGKKAESKVKHDRYNENIDLLIKNAQSIIKLNGERECAFPPTATQKANHKANQKIKIEQILAILPKGTKNISLDEICQKINDKSGLTISRIAVSLLLSHYIRKYKGKAVLKKLKKFLYRIK